MRHSEVQLETKTGEIILRSDTGRGALNHSTNTRYDRALANQREGQEARKSFATSVVPGYVRVHL